MLFSNRASIMATLFVFISVFTVIGCGGNDATTAQDDSKGKAAIKVGDQTISQSEFNQRINQQLTKLKSRLKRLPKKKRKRVMQQQKQRLKQQVAQQMVTQLVVESKLAQADINVYEDEVNEKLEKFKENFPNEKAMKQALQQRGRSLSELKDQIRKRVKFEKYLEQQIGTINVSDKEARDHFKQNESQYSQPEKVKARHILIKNDTDAQSKINKVRKRLDDGEDFAKVAREESEGPSARKGGDLGYITGERMVQPFSDAAFGLKVGEISDPVKTRYGHHFIKVEDRKEAKQVSFEDVEDTVIQQVKNQKRQKRIQELLKKWRQEADVQINVPGVSLQPRKRQPAASPPQ